MREVEIIVNEEYVETVSVDDFFTFSVKYHNLSSTADTIHESERVIIHQSTTGIWLIGDNELLIGEDGNLRDISKELSFFLEWQNPDSIHSPISLKMLFYAIVDSLKHDSWKSFDSYQGHSIRISEIAQHYSKKAKEEEQKSIQKGLNEVILGNLKKDLFNHVKKELKPTPEERKQRGIAALDRLNSLKPKAPTVPDTRQAAIDRREKDTKVPITKAVDFTSPLVKEQLAYKKWIGLPHIVRSLILLNYEDREGKFMPKFWDGTDYTQRKIILQQLVS